MIENLRIDSKLGPVGGSAKIIRTGERDGGREKKKFEGGVTRDDLAPGEVLKEEEMGQQSASREESLEGESVLGKVINIRV